MSPSEVLVRALCCFGEHLCIPRELAGCYFVESVIPWRPFSSGVGEYVAAGAWGALETDSLSVTSSCLASGKSLHCSEHPFSQLENGDEYSCSPFLGLS